MVEVMKKLLWRATVDILKLENRVEELEEQLKIPIENRFTVRGPMLA